MHGDRDQYGNLWIGRTQEAAAARDSSPEARAAATGAAELVEGPPPPLGDGEPHVRAGEPTAPFGLNPWTGEPMRPAPQLDLPGVAPGLRAPISELGWLGLDSRNGRLLAGDGAITSGAVAFGEVREIVVRPQRPFRGRYLWVHSAIARSFLIHAVRVGHVIAGVAPTPLPADIFAVNYDDIATLKIHDVEPGTVMRIEVLRIPAEMPGGDPSRAWRGVPFDLPAASPGMEIGIMVENIERKVFEPARFLGAFLGDMVR